jgi:N-acetylhexosamine 1-kinase
MHVDERPREVLKKYVTVSDNIVSITPLLRGHLNQTFKVLVNSETFILQRINESIFHEIQRLMDNMSFMLTELRTQGIVVGAPSLGSVHLVLSLSKTSFVRDRDGFPWRLMTYVPNSMSFDTPPSARIVSEAGRGAGLFLAATRHIDARKMHVVLPGFQDTESRMARLAQAQKDGISHRSDRARDSLAFLFDHRDEAALIGKVTKFGTVPLRVTHGDMKLNNLLFDSLTSEFLCFIDLDTVMGGTVLYDFGDLCRTASVLGAEESEEHIEFSLLFFEKLTEGFAQTYREFLTESERKLIGKSLLSVVLTLAARFLTDYLLGDKYFAIRHSEHNLERARAQIALAKQIIVASDDIHRICACYL